MKIKDSAVNFYFTGVAFMTTFRKPVSVDFTAFANLRYSNLLFFYCFHCEDGIPFPVCGGMIIDLQDHLFRGVTYPIHHDVDVDTFVPGLCDESVP